MRYFVLFLLFSVLTGCANKTLYQRKNQYKDLINLRNSIKMSKLTLKDPSMNIEKFRKLYGKDFVEDSFCQ